MERNLPNPWQRQRSPTVCRRIQQNKLGMGQAIAQLLYHRI
jgi:hypothetical protein